MLFKCSLLLLCATMMGGPVGRAQKLVWKQRAPLPLPRSGYMAGEIGGKYVVAGGSYWVGKKKHWSNEVDIFNPAANAWSKAASLPQPRSDAASVVYDGALYVWGGATPDHFRADALEFRNGKWTALPAANLPGPRVYSVAVVCQGRVYLLGGMSKSGDYSSVSNALWTWNPKVPQKGWQVLPPLPGPGLINHAMASVNGKIYVLGGATHGGKNVVNVKAAFEFAPETGKWTRLADLPIGRRCWWGVGLANSILLLGGYTADYERDVFTYQLPSGELLNAGSMPHGICAAEFVRIGDSIIGTGGEVAPGIRGKWTIQARLP
jgi:N-acetylneuraminic acid mutarotase